MAILKNVCLPVNGGLCSPAGTGCPDCSQILTNSFYSYPTLDFWRVNQTGCTIPYATWLPGTWVYFPSCHIANVKWNIAMQTFGASDVYCVPQIRINGVPTDLVTYQLHGSGAIYTNIVIMDNGGLGWDKVDGIGSRVYGNAGDVNSGTINIFKYEAWSPVVSPTGYII